MKKSANGNNGSKWIRRDKRLAIYLRDGFCCVYCGQDLHDADPHDVTLDHLSPGHADHRESNLVTACRPCNSSRQGRAWQEFAAAAAVERISRARRRKLGRHRRLAKKILARKRTEP